MRSDTQVNKDKHRDVESLRSVTWINAYTKSAPYIFSNCSLLYSVKGTAGWLKCQKKPWKSWRREGKKKIPNSVICLWRNECLCHKELGQKTPADKNSPTNFWLPGKHLSAFSGQRSHFSVSCSPRCLHPLARKCSDSSRDKNVCACHGVSRPTVSC